MPAPHTRLATTATTALLAAGALTLGFLPLPHASGDTGPAPTPYFPPTTGTPTKNPTGGGPVSPADPTKGYDGPCTGEDAKTGTTMVIDFQDLDGNAGIAAPMIVRCSPTKDPSKPRSGLQALEDAGIEVEGAARWGLAFICRINDRPNSTEDIQVPGKSNYHERCGNTPPAAAYWSYWISDGKATGTDADGTPQGTWGYSSRGVTYRDVIPGGFDGWSFSHNATASTNPMPRYNPVTAAATPSESPTPTASPSPSETASPTPSESASPNPSDTPTASPTPSESASPTPAPSETASPTPSQTASPAPSESAAPTGGASTAANTSAGPATPSVVLNPARTGRGGTVTMRISGAEPSSLIVIALDGKQVLGQVVTDAQGSAVFTYTATTDPGRHTLTAATAAGLVAAELTVEGSTGTVPGITNPGLAATGGAAPLIPLTAAALGAGALIARRIGKH